jgi:hypothetical protein
VLHRLFASGSDRAAERWREDYLIPGTEGLELHHLYRAMAFLGDAIEQLKKPTGAVRCNKDLIEEALFERRRDPWHASASRNGRFDAAHKSNDVRRSILMHRLVLYAPRGKEVDHINGDTLDNRRGNLRLAAHDQNGHNRKIQRNNASGFKGVSCYKRTGLWGAYIKFRGKQYHLGYFDTPELAAREYDRAARLLLDSLLELTLLPLATTPAKNCYSFTRSVRKRSLYPTN